MATTFIETYDANGTKKAFVVESNGSSQLTAHSVLEADNAPVSSTHGLPVAPSVITITTTYASVTQTSSVVLAANANRKYLAIVNVGLNRCTLGFGTAAVTGQGFPCSASATQGDQGGGLTMESSLITQQAIQAVCPGGLTTNLVILEGV